MHERCYTNKVYSYYIIVILIPCTVLPVKCLFHLPPQRALTWSKLVLQEVTDELSLLGELLLQQLLVLLQAGDGVTHQIDLALLCLQQGFQSLNLVQGRRHCAKEETCHLLGNVCFLCQHFEKSN